MRRTAVDLFSGVGGFALACEWAGVETIAFAEIDDYASRVLARRFPEIKNYGDVRALPAISDVWLLTGGPPCQPASIAGQRRGASDDRWLWPEAIAAVDRLKPTWVCLENPLGILSLEKPVMSFDLEGYGNLIETAIHSEGDFWPALPGEIEFIFRDLVASVEALGYHVAPVIVPACGVGALHRRYRVWIMGHANSAERRTITEGRHEPKRHNTGGFGLASETDSITNPNGGRAHAESKRITKRKDAPNADRDGSLRSLGHAASLQSQPGKQSAWSDKTRHAGSRNVSDAESISGQVRTTAKRSARRPSSGSDVSDTQQSRRERDEREILARAREGRSDANITGSDWWLIEPDVGRVADGISARLDRLRTLGNAIVPQVAYQLIKRMIEAES